MNTAETLPHQREKEEVAQACSRALRAARAISARFGKALDLHAVERGPRVWDVTGGEEPRVVNLTGATGAPLCDCPHHKKSRAVCKHVMHCLWISGVPVAQLFAQALTVELQQQPPRAPRRRKRNR